MMTIMMMLAGLTLFVYMIIVSIDGHIPKRGRWIDVDGEELIATITNTNKNADRYATIRAVGDDGRKYSAKLRPTEARCWIKGDKIKITLTADGKNYRVHFHEYFKENEERIREKVIEKLENSIKFYSIAAKMTGYNKESLETLRASKANSQIIFAFETYMRSVNNYFVFGIIAAALCVPFVITEKLQRFHFLFPVIILAALFLSVTSTAKLCNKIYKNATKQG